MQKYKVRSTMTGYWYGTKREIIDCMKRFARNGQGNVIYQITPCNEYRQLTGPSENLKMWHREVIDEMLAEENNDY